MFQGLRTFSARLPRLVVLFVAMIFVLNVAVPRRALNRRPRWRR